MRRFFVLGLGLCLAACSGESDDDEPITPRDGGSVVRDAGDPERDGGPRDGGATRRDAGFRDGGQRDAGLRDGGDSPCPTAGDYVGDGSWAGSLDLPEDLTLCRFASRFEPIASVHANKRQLRIPAGTYALPTELAAPAPMRMPMCFASQPSPEIAQGTVVAERRQDFEDPAEMYYTTLTMPVADGSEVVFSTKLSIGDPTLTIAGPRTSHTELGASHCVSATCFEEVDAYLAPCNLLPRMCDELDFDDGAVVIDQFHWAGSVGAGFAAPTRVRGNFRGTDFDIDEYAQMSMAYGHHAFNRELLFFFDQPIDGVCGLHFAEVTEFGQLMPVDLVDCDGQTLGTSPITADRHTFGTPCP